MLSPLFSVKLCGFQLDAPIVSSRGHPPYVLRGQVGDRAFNTTACMSPAMRPIWEDVIVLDYLAPSIEQLTTKYLTIECYGGDSFLGSCRIPLYSVATGPTEYALDVKDGIRDIGRLSFQCFFELVSDVSIQLQRVRIDNLPRLGYDDAPNPYLSVSIGPGGEVMESPIAAQARSPQWATLPSLSFKGTYRQLRQQRITVTLKHCRNAFSISHADPLMSVFTIALDQFPIEPRSSSVPLRMRFHSDPNFPFPFSSEITASIEFRNVHSVIQQVAGVATDTKIIGGVSAVATRSSPVQSYASRATSPPRVRAAPPPPPSFVNVSNIATPQQSYLSQPYVAPSQVQQSFASAVPPPSVPLPSVAPEDLQVMDDVTSKQSALLAKVQARLSDIARRKADVTSQIAAAKANEDIEIETASQRKAQLDKDLHSALQEKDRLEEHLRSIQGRREDEGRIAVQQAAERERAKRALEEEQQEAVLMQQRVVQLRTEMTRHLEEEERRYQQRVREAADARRRTDEDAAALAELESRLVDAELRAAARQKDDTHRSTRRASPSRYR